MKNSITKTLTAAAAAALLLAGCSEGGDTGDDATEEGGENTAVYNEIASWNACEILNNLQPITDEMGILGYGSSTAEGGEPGNSELGNTFDPDAIGCGGLFYLGENEGLGGEGEIRVKIIPTDTDEDATAAFEERLSAAESDAAANEDAATTEFSDSWDQGALVSWAGAGSAPWLDVIAREGQWLFQIQLNHTQDYGLGAGGDPAFTFTDAELNEWLVSTYLPDVNQAINERLTEVQ